MSDTTVIIYYVQCLGAAIYRKANQRDIKELQL